MSTMNVRSFRNPDYYINPETRFILKAKNTGEVYAIAVQTEDSSLRPLISDEKALAGGMGLLTDDGSMLRELQETIENEYVYHVTIPRRPDLPPGEPLIPYIGEPGVYGVRKDGSRVLIRNV